MLQKMQRQKWKKFAFVIALITIIFGNANGYANILPQQQQQQQIETTSVPKKIIATSTNEAETLTIANANAAEQTTQKLSEISKTTTTTLTTTKRIEESTTTKLNDVIDGNNARAHDVDKASKHFETPNKYEEDIATTPTPTPTEETATAGATITAAITQLSSVERETEKTEIASINTEVDIAGTTVAASIQDLTENQIHNANGEDENIEIQNVEIYERRDEIATEAAANNTAQNVETYRGIQLAEIVNDSDRESSHYMSLQQQDQQQNYGQQQEPTVEEQHYEVQETLPNKLDADNKPPSKLNIVDLYATNNAAHSNDAFDNKEEVVDNDDVDVNVNIDVDDGFKHIIKDSNEKLIKERNIFKQSIDAEEHRQNLVPNDVEMQANARTKSSGHMKSVNRAASDDNVSDFTGKLLADQDDVITEIEQKFQLNVPLATATNIIATDKAEENSEKAAAAITPTAIAATTNTPASETTTTTHKPRRKIPVIAGHEFIERRVKKSFGFPMHHGFSASDVMSAPHVDFANTKFTDANGYNFPQPANAMPATNNIQTMTTHAMNSDSAVSNVGNVDRVSAPAAPMGLTATHPEFSTTKFYNSKELYNELLQKKLHAGNTMFTATATTTNKNTSNIAKTTTVITTAATSTKPRSGTSRATIKPTVAVGSILTLKKLKELAETATKATTTSSSTTSTSTKPTIIKLATTTKTTKSATSKENGAIKRVTLEATMPTDTLTITTTKPQAIQVSTLPSSSASASTSTPKSSKILATTESTANISTAATSSFLSTSTSLKTKKFQKAQIRAKMLLKAFSSSNKNNVKINKTTVAVTVDRSDDKSDSPLLTSTSSSVQPTEVTFFAYANAATTNTLTAHQQQQQQQPQLQQPPIVLAKPSQMSAIKTIARPRILSRLQEKINALECELLNVPPDSHLWRGNETHELLLPIMTPINCNTEKRCTPEAVSWEGEAEIQSGDILIVEINDALLDLYDKHNASIAHTTQVYQVTRPGHEHCDVTEGILLDITPLVVDGRKLVTLYDKDLTEGVNLLIVVSELWGKQCVRLKVTTKTDNCGENADCSGKGVCYSNQAMEEYECQCCSGFAGPHCEEIDACTPSPCTNNGICVDLSQGHEGNSYQCLCPYGYTGKNCQYESDPCNAADCLNGGTCIGNSTHFRCDCTAGYTGPLCQHSLNECESSPCVHGICVDQEDGFRCFCQPGFAGELCNFEYNECESNPCQNSGECIDHIGSYECHCTKGYTGNRCQIKVDFCANKPCPEGHRCLDHGNDFSCECTAGLNGIDCGNMPRMQCNVNPCTHGGTCWSSGDSFYCACRPGFTGTMCEDEFVVETVVSSSEFMVDDTSARNFNDKTFGSSVVLKSPIELHNAYFAAGVLAAALFIVAIVVTICHCKVNQTYRKFSTRSTTFFPIIGFGRRPKIQNKLNKHWLSGKGFGSASTGGIGSSGTTSNNSSTALRTNTTTQRTQQHTNTNGSIGGQLHERPFQRHLAMNLENDMYYTVDFSENSQHSPLIQ